MDLHNNFYIPIRERLDGIVELMAEICCYNKAALRINREDIPADVVKKRFLELNSEHIRYVIDSMDRNTSAIGNIRMYIVSSLFNSSVTMSQYYASLVQHDMANEFSTS